MAQPSFSLANVFMDTQANYVAVRNNQKLILANSYVVLPNTLVIVKKLSTPLCLVDSEFS